MFYKPLQKTNSSFYYWFIININANVWYFQIPCNSLIELWLKIYNTKRGLSFENPRSFNFEFPQLWTQITVIMAGSWMINTFQNPGMLWFPERNLHKPITCNADHSSKISFPIFAFWSGIGYDNRFRVTCSFTLAGRFTLHWFAPLHFPKRKTSCSGYPDSWTFATLRRPFAIFRHSFESLKFWSENFH